VEEVVNARMRILQLDIRGFRSLKDVGWRPEGLNVIIGPNGTGKSNLLRFLELISIAAQGRLGKHVQSSGGMEPIVWDGQAPAISFTLKTQPIGGDIGPERYELELTRLGNSSSYKVGKELLASYARVKRGEKHTPFKFLERTEWSSVVFDENEHRFVAAEESVPEDETLLSVARGPFSGHRLIPVFQAQLSSIAVYHDLHVNRDAVIRQPAVARTEKRVDQTART
jgi:predicted ATPase